MTATVGGRETVGRTEFSGQELGVTLTGTSPSLILGAIGLELEPLGEWTFADQG